MHSRKYTLDRLLDIGDHIARQQAGNVVYDLPKTAHDEPVQRTIASVVIELGEAIVALVRRPEWGDPIVYLAPDNIRRPVDWRWQVACRRQLGQRLPVTSARISQAQELVASLLACRSDADRDRLDQREPILHPAYSIYRGSDKLARGRLEAYLLGRLSFDEIAGRCGCTTAVVEAYEQLYFSVRDRLKHPLLIRDIAFDGRRFDGAPGISDDDVDLILKRAGFEQAGAALEPMLRYYASNWETLSQDNLPARPDLVNLHRIISMRKLILVWLTPPQIDRAKTLHEMGLELERLLRAWPEGADLPSSLPFAAVKPTPARLQAWWASWRNAVDLARRVPGSN
jgi:hypothetical protein